MFLCEKEKATPSKKSIQQHKTFPIYEPKSVRNIIQFFETTAVTKPGGPSSKVNSEKIANSSDKLIATTTTKGREKVKLKSKVEKSKLCPPSNYKFQSISKHFVTKPRAGKLEEQVAIKN